VAFKIGAIRCAILSGAASTLACIAGSSSHAANAAPFPRTSGPKLHIQPKPRGRRASGVIGSRSAGENSRFATGGFRIRVSSRSPASIRRISAESARSRVRNQPCATSRNTGEISRSGDGARIRHARSATGRATRRTTAFTRRSRVERNGAGNMFGVLF
jgi:hypothetical protein